MRFPKLRFGPLVVVGLVAASRPSFATSTVACGVRFASGGSLRLPANAPAIPVAASGVTNLRFRGATPAESPSFSLADDPGTGVTLLVPDAPLAAGGRYDVSVAFDCPTLGETAITTNAVVDAAPSAPLPTEVGSLAARSPDDYFDASVALTPSPELAAYLPVTRFELFVDGTSFATTEYGGATLDPDGTVALQDRLCAAEGVSGLTTVDVELRAHVAGAAADPAPAELRGLAVNCTRPAYLDAAPPSSDSGGCSAGGARRTGNAAPAALAAATALALVAARRRRPKLERPELDPPNLD